jgi:hypothetical protein
MSHQSVLKSHQLTFNLGQALERKAAGMDDAANARRPALEIARQAAIAAARSRPDNTATADDAYRGLLAAGYLAADLGPAAGCLFRGKNWTYTGRRKRSARVSNHGRALRIWKLVNFPF